MTRPRKYALNPRQLALLRRIVEGVDPVTSNEPQLALAIDRWGLLATSAHHATINTQVLVEPTRF